MFRRKSLPLGVLVMLLVLALASLGIGYGLWSKILHINGTVATGNVDVELSLGKFGDNETEKDVGDCKAELLTLPPAEQPNKIRVTVTNAYPSYECWVTFDVHQKGSIPVLVYQPIFTQVPPKEVTFRMMDCYADETQMDDPSERIWCTLYIHVEQDALQNAGRGEGYPPVYKFEGTIEARQFNEPRP